MGVAAGQVSGPPSDECKAPSFDQSEGQAFKRRPRFVFLQGKFRTLVAVIGKKNSKAEIVGIRERARNGEEGEG